MSRHRIVRQNLRHGQYSVSYEDDDDPFGSMNSPIDPSLQAYMKGSGGSSDGDPYYHVPADLMAIVRHDSDCDVVLDCVSHLADMLDDTWSWKALVALAREANYDVDAAFEIISRRAKEEEARAPPAEERDEGLFDMDMDMGTEATPPPGLSAPPGLGGGSKPNSGIGAVLSTGSGDAANGRDSNGKRLEDDGAAIKAEALKKKESRTSDKGSRGGGKPSEPLTELRTDSLRTSGEKATASPKPKKVVKQRSAARDRQVKAAIEELGASTNKPLLNMVVCGHVDAGKSTMMGHLLFLIGDVTQRQLHKFEQEAKREGKASFAYAWVMDAHSEERARGVTMDVAVRHFETEHRSICLLDAPGHRDFVPNMISGAAQADVALLVINSTRGEFETGFLSDGQTKEHAMLLRSLGVAHLVVVVNKMDTVDWSQERYVEIESILRPFLKQAGFRDKNVRFVPASGFLGQNLVSAPEDGVCSWYEGDTLIQAIDKFGVPKRDIDGPLRFSITDVFKGAQSGSMLAGKIEMGTIAAGDNIVVSPEMQHGTVKAVIGSTEQNKDFAVAGENIEIVVTGLDIAQIRVGSYVCDPANYITTTCRFYAQIITFDMKTPMTLGYSVVLHTQNINEPATVTRLFSILDKASGEVIKKRPRCVPQKSTATVEITLPRPVCLELFPTSKQLGRFTLRQGGRTVAAGIVTKRFKKARGSSKLRSESSQTQ